MRSSTNSAILASAVFSSLALARTDLVGCTSTDVSSPAGASIAWYVPGTGELCDFLDCGGGRAPAKTDVPGCAAYEGTETYSPSYLPGYQASATAAPSTAEASEAESTPEPSNSQEDSAATTSSFNWDSLVSEAPEETSSWDLYTTLAQGASDDMDLSSSAAHELSSSSIPAEITESAAVTSGVVAIPTTSTLAVHTSAGTAPNGTVVSPPAGNGTVGNGSSPSASDVPESEGGAAPLLVSTAGMVVGLVGLVAAL